AGPSRERFDWKSEQLRGQPIDLPSDSLQEDEFSRPRSIELAHARFRDDRVELVIREAVLPEIDRFVDLCEDTGCELGTPLHPHYVHVRENRSDVLRFEAPEIVRVPVIRKPDRSRGQEDYPASPADPLDVRDRPAQVSDVF